MAESETGAAHGGIERLFGELRPKLHRYCARMTGSVVDGEDVVQESLVKALEALPEAGTLRHPEGWLFRIARNAALDFLRRRNRLRALESDADPDQVIDLAAAADQRQVVTASLATFMRLPVAERSSVILMDVLGYSLQEIGSIANSSVPAVKAALHRGRSRLRAMAHEPDAAVPALPAAERQRLAVYVDRFNARDFDAIRDMLAADVALDLVSRTRLSGRSAVGRYFTNYSAAADWRLMPGLVDGQPALLVSDPAQPGAPPGYFILLTWAGDRIAGIRDFRHARYAIDGAALAEAP